VGFTEHEADEWARGFRALADPIRPRLFSMIAAACVAAACVDGACVWNVMDQSRLDVLREALG
jgi:hypothetical protein